MVGQGRHTLAVAALFVGSGCAALIYEIVWFQLLTLVIGASAVSLAILLASFMGGMCLGSVLWPRLVTAEQNPLKMYAWLECGIAALGVLMLMLLPRIGMIYWPIAGHGTWGVLLRGVVAGVILLPPTICMGATLPAVARWVKSTRMGWSHLGLFYGANTFGAVVGTLLAGFYLLPVHNITVATITAVAVNLLVAGMALWLAKSAEYSPVPAAKLKAAPSARAIHIVVAISGITALGAEVIWTRLLSLLFGPTVYTFSILLAVFLTGLGIGSAIGSRWSRRLRWPAFGLAGCQLLLAAAIPFGAFMIAQVLPHWLAERNAAHSAFWRFSVDLFRAAAAMLPAAVLWGASFPLAVAAAGRKDCDNGALAGRIYAFNTFGAIVGSLLFGLVALPSVGTHAAQQILTVLSALGGIVMLAAACVNSRSEATPESNPSGSPYGIAMVGIVLAPIAALFLSSSLPAVPAGLLAYGRRVDLWELPLEYVVLQEGLDATVAVTRRNETYRDFHVSGKVVASNDPLDLRIERMLGHLPAIAQGEPRNALVIGCGAGVTAGSLTLHDSLERLVICEIEAQVPRAAGEWFSQENYNVLNDSRTTLIHDDARHFLASTDEKFDVITSDPIHPWVRGAAALYTEEFLTICRQHLNPGGVLALWVPLYESSEPAVKCQVATFGSVFPDCTIWSSEMTGRGYDVVLLGTADGKAIQAEQLNRHIARNPAVLRSLAEVQLSDAGGLLNVFLGRTADLTGWLADAEINRDANLRLQYLAGLAPDAQIADQIYQAMAAEIHGVVARTAADHGYPAFR